MRRFLHESYDRRAWARLLYALVSAPLGVLGFVYLVALWYAGLVLTVTLLGLPLLAAGLYGTRGLGTVRRWLVTRLLAVDVAAPDPPRPASGLVDWIRARLTDRVAWRAMLYLVLATPLSLVTLAATVGSWAYGVVFVAVPIRLTPAVRRYLRPDDLAVGNFHFDSWPYALPLALFGLLVLAAAPWVTRGLLAIDRVLVVALLGPGQRSRTGRLRETRARAVDDSAAVLRRIERDLHDGAQAQLVALAMRLGEAKEELAEGDTEAALALVDTAHAGAKLALVELRDLARGIHPPALDTGLGPALESLAARGAMPVELRVDLSDRPSPAIETIAYFSAAELLANVAKHSRATRAAVSLTRLRDGWLRLTVRDDGIGGARPGSGLTGLAERVRTVDGRLDLYSPPGGPTVATVDLPAHA